jgi:hypothetical protein
MRGLVEIRDFLISLPLRSDEPVNILICFISFDIILDAVQSRSGCNGEDNILNTPARTRTPSHRAIAQTGSRCLPTAATRVPSQVRLYRICGGQSGSGAGFLRVLRVLLSNPIPQTVSNLLTTLYKAAISFICSYCVVGFSSRDFSTGLWFTEF